MRAQAQTRAGRPALRLARRILVVVLAAYAVAVAGAWAFQRSLIYFPQRLEGIPPSPTSSGEEIVTFPSTDGVRISGIYVHARDERSPVVFVAHGNAGNVLSWRAFLDPFTRRGLGAFLLDPRGYGWSEGSPSEEGWHRDADAALAWLAARGVPASRLVVVGVSIGCGLALPVAADRPVRGLILESPFTSLADAASDHFPFLPCAWLLRDRYDNLAAAPRVRCPVLILHGTNDRTVSPEHSKRLAAAFSTHPTLRLADGAGHDDLGAWPGYEGALAAFLRSLP